jgi:hypothetical protein
MFKRKRHYFKGKNHERASQDNKNHCGNYITDTDSPKTVPPCGDQGKTGKYRKQGPALGKGYGDKPERGKKKEQSNKEKKGCEKQIKGALIQFYGKKCKKRADNNKEEGPEHG